MIETGVEFHIVTLILPLHHDLSEGLLPCFLRSCFGLIEANVGCLILEVDTGILNRSIGYADLDGNLLVVLGVEVKIGSGTYAVCIGLVFANIIAIEHTYTNGFRINIGREIDTLVGVRLVLLNVFGARDNPSLYRSILVDPDFCILHLSALALLMTDIENEMRHFCLGIGEAKKGNASSCSHFCIDIIIIQHHLVISCCSILIIVGKGGTIASGACAVGITWRSEQKARGGSYCDASDLKLMGANEALDGLVAIVVAGSLPAVGITQ